MYRRIDENLKKYVERTENGLIHTEEMPKEFEEMFEEIRKRELLHEEMVGEWKQKI